MRQPGRVEASAKTRETIQKNRVMETNTKEARYRSDACTVADVIHNMMPSWKSLEDWFMWPPDVFLMTSILFKRTGCYRYVLSEREWTYNFKKQPWSEEGWQKDIDKKAIRWMEQINDYLIQSHTAAANGKGVAKMRHGRFLSHLIEDMSLLIDKVTIQELKVLQGEDALKLCQKLVMAHAVADEACAGFGLLTRLSPKSALVNYLANLLLVARGTLSAVPKFYGIVIPKMRTPQSGISVRSLSIHLTFHTTEVEVMWRTIPWANIEENTLNVLAIPWPDQVQESCFSVCQETFLPIRYFSYDQKPSGDKLLDSVVELIQRIDKEIGRVHILTFPEMALTVEEYEQLLYKLMLARAAEKIRHNPMIITGIRQNNRNEIRLAAYFAGKWYDLTQSKHHRWKLNRSQIRQYSLEGRLATARDWFENIAVEQRRLTFMVPNGWLALCPLICEDLAQLEPVSEVIRGVGPSLLIALLMDGPQLKERWPARYASVFADDPGTAVLTLTSIGMVARSKSLQEGSLVLREDMSNGNADTSIPRNIRNIALWKDQIKGWFPIELSKSHEAVLLTLSADMAREFTADGRSDNGFASVFKLEGGRQFSIHAPSKGSSKGTVNAESLQTIEKEKWRGDWMDIRELTALTYALDTLLTLNGKHVGIIEDWLLAGREPNKDMPENDGRNLSDLIILLGASHKSPSITGISAVKREWPTQSLEQAVEEMKVWSLALANSTENELQYWEELFDKANIRLSQLADGQLVGTSEISSPKPSTDRIEQEKEVDRIKRAVPLAVLFALHRKLELLKRKNYGSYSTKKAGLLLTNIETALHKFAY